ncbi:hypothetical protein J7T55_001226 [Diaporthe amygdali]|uniref:uncharacterized protein n=1 Tax=Phomopsis amygdali TaxID=1214568 RepID=UPI0022FE9528|nr:uncharacterized protein J7T55_001226 [Diaporthe amygdali]KAJ0103856.1 hypothetical protein J7T55_001226 [Diaporthe amygdali]
MVSETSTLSESSMSSDSSGWSTTSEPTEGIVLTDHAAVHGARLDSSKKQIRLLQILPLEADHDPKDEIVHCRMFKTFLNDFDPSFNALSYTWGSPDEQTNIVVNETTVSVTTNLESALRHLRDYHLNTTCGFPLWVDAICINQDDTEEQNSQVGSMKEQLVCCLGSGKAMLTPTGSYRFYATLIFVRRLPNKQNKWTALRQGRLLSAQSLSQWTICVVDPGGLAYGSYRRSCWRSVIRLFLSEAEAFLGRNT